MYRWESCILFACEVSLLITVGVIIVRTVYKKNIGVNKLTFLPYYWSFGQLMVGLIYLAVYLSMDKEEGYFVLIWKSTFVKFSNICLDGILLTLALTMNLVTALIRF